MNAYLPRSFAAVAAIAALAGAVVAPAAGAATAGQTVKVTAESAYVDNKAPGRVVSGTIFRGNRFKIHRIARVARGSAAGSHSIFMSQPAAVAGLIEQAASEVASVTR